MAVDFFMSYIVKRRIFPQSRNHELPASYRTPLEALDFACTALRQGPTEIWIEGPCDVRIQEEIIHRHCQSRQSTQHGTSPAGFSN